MTMQSDDEYQYPEQEYLEKNDVVGSADDVTEKSSDEQAAEHSATEAEGGSSKRSQIITDVLAFVSKYKRIFMVLLAALMILLFYHFTHNASSSAKSAVANTQQPAAQPMVQSPQQSSTLRAMDSAMKTQYGQLSQQTGQNQQSIEQLNEQVAQLQGGVQQIGADESQMDRSIKELTAHISALIKQQSPKKSAVGKTTHYQPVKIVYVLKAVVPGRAWIQGSNNTTDSLRVGDSVPNSDYGKVTQINANQGVVQTSSGKSIVFGPNDS